MDTLSRYYLINMLLDEKYPALFSVIVGHFYAECIEDNSERIAKSEERALVQKSYQNLLPAERERRKHILMKLVYDIVADMENVSNENAEKAAQEIEEVLSLSPDSSSEVSQLLYGLGFGHSLLFDSWDDAKKFLYALQKRLIALRDEQTSSARN